VIEVRRSIRPVAPPEDSTTTATPARAGEQSTTTATPARAGEQRTTDAEGRTQAGPPTHGAHTVIPEPPSSGGGKLLGGQPVAVWVVAFAAMVSFMGIGLVDPILKPIAANLNATASQVSLLFTSYLIVTAFAMLITSYFSSRFGGRTTLIIGLIVIIAFASLAGTSNTVGALIGWRAGWGLGNALFIATALAAIVAVARGGSEKAITLYEAALGIGISAGPLIGAALGGIQWRMPFFGVAALMLIALIAILFLLKTRVKTGHGVTIGAPFKALGHGGLLVMGIAALLYNGGFFAVIATAPFAVPLGVYGIGGMFFGWGVLVGIFAVWGAPRMHAAMGLVAAFAVAIAVFALLLVGVALEVRAGSTTGVVIFVILCGAPLGVLNTLFTQSAMNVAPVPRPVASAGYNFVRFLGGAISPYVCSKLGESFGWDMPFWLGAVCVGVALGVMLIFGRKYLQAINAVH
jgi:MFS family permease